MDRKKDSMDWKIEKLESDMKKLRASLDALKREKEEERPPPEEEKRSPEKKEAAPRKKTKKAEKKAPVIKPEPVLPPPEVEPSDTARMKWLQFERMVGERWLVWVGALVFATGVGIFLKYAFEQGWVNEFSRIILGFLGGMLSIWFGEFLFKKKYEALAQGISSLGLIILYLTIFTAYHFYHLLSIQWAFGFLFVVTIGGMLIAIIHNGFAMAFLSVFGAFATPLMLADPASTLYYEPFLFSYLFIINVGVLFVSSMKRWRTISLVSFVFTVMYFLSWFVGEYKTSDFALAAGFATAYFVLFSFMSTPQSIIWKKRSHVEDSVLIGLNTVIFLIIGYTMLYDRGGHTIIPLIPLGMAAYHFVLAGIIRRINRQDMILYSSFMATAIALLTLPIPLLVKRCWITVAWGAEALALVLMGSTVIKRKALRIGGAAIFLLVLMRLFTVDSFLWYHSRGGSFLFFNLKFLAQFLSTLSLGLGALLFSRFKAVSVKERALKVPLCTFFIIALFWVMNHDLFSYFAAFKGLSARMMLPYSTMLWTGFFLWLFIYGIMKENKALRFSGFCLMMVTAIKVLLIDYTVLYDYYEFNYPLLLNVKFLSVACFLLSILICALIGAKNKRGGVALESGELWLLWGTFTSVLFFSLNMEIYSFFSPMEKSIRMLRYVISSMMWTGFSFWFIVVGILRQEMRLRIIGFIFVGLAAFKIFFFDTPMLYQYQYGYPFILNLKFLSLAMLLGVVATAAVLYSKRQIGGEKKQGITMPVLWTTFVSLLFLGLNVEIVSFFARSEIAAVRLESHIFTSMLWTIFSLFLIVFGMRRRITPMRVTGIIIASFALFKVILSDSTVLYMHPYGLPFLINLKFAAAALLLFTFAYAAVLYTDRKESLQGVEKGMGPYLWTLFLILLFVELHSQAAFSLYRHWDLGEQRATFALSLLWAVYGFGLLLVGIWKKIFPLRITALCLFGITLCKVFFVDLRFTGKLYKMFVLLGIGIIFLMAAYFYRKYRQRLQEKSEDEEMIR